MRVLRLRSGLDAKTMFSRLDKLDAIAVRSEAIGSVEETELALLLAQRAFASKKNIARQLKYEFLLWLSGKTDIASAMKTTAPADNAEFLVVVLSDSKRGDAVKRGAAGLKRGEAVKEQADVVRLLDAKELPLGLEQKAEPLALERISLSRI